MGLGKGRIVFRVQSVSGLPAYVPVEELLAVGNASVHRVRTDVEMHVVATGAGPPEAANVCAAIAGYQACDQGDGKD